MIELPYSLVIEATEEPDHFGFYSTELEGFTGIGHSIEDCLYNAWEMGTHLFSTRRRHENICVPFSSPFLGRARPGCAGRACLPATQSANNPAKNTAIFVIFNM